MLLINMAMLIVLLWWWWWWLSFRLLLHAAEGELVAQDPDVQKSALHIICNCVSYQPKVRES